jgi:hypothetical protein
LETAAPGPADRKASAASKPPKAESDATPKEKTFASFSRRMKSNEPAAPMTYPQSEATSNENGWMFMALRHPPAPHPQKILARNNFPASHRTKLKETF